jgi:hypothetical protein
MKASLKTMGMTVAVLLGLFVLVGQSWAQDAKSPPSPEDLLKALAEAGKPGAEHKKLEPFVGNWTFTMKVWTDPTQAPAELKGTIERRWIMDGRFVHETLHGECAKTGKSFEGMGLLGYDAGQKTFTCVKACSLCGTISSNQVSCDPTGTRFECATEACCPLTSEKIKGRVEVLIQGNDRIVINDYKTFNDREVKVAEIVTLRQK